MRSATGVPICACLSTATICSTLNHFRFTASSFPFPGAIMPETLPQIGIKIGGPTNSLIRFVRVRLISQSLELSRKLASLHALSDFIHTPNSVPWSRQQPINASSLKYYIQGTLEGGALLWRKAAGKVVNKVEDITALFERLPVSFFVITVFLVWRCGFPHISVRSSQ